MRHPWWLGLLLIPAIVPAQDNQDPLTTEGYIRPSAEMEEAATAPWHEHITPSNWNRAQTHFVRTISAGPVRLADMARPHHNLAGLQFDPISYTSRRNVTRRSIGLEVWDLEGKTVSIDVPRGGNVFGTSWSPSGKWIAFMVEDGEASHLYVADAMSGESKRVTTRPLVATTVTRPQWSHTPEQVWAVIKPSGTHLPPRKSYVAESPIVRMADERETRLRTYADLLSSPYEADLLEHYLTGQIVAIDPSTGRADEIGEPAVIVGFDAAPNAKAARMTVMERPYSYLHPWSSFARRETIIDREGKKLTELSFRPTPGQGRRGGQGQGRNREQAKRSMDWHISGLGLSYLQLGPEDDGKRMDRYVLWSHPYGKDDVKVLHEQEEGISSLMDIDEGSAFITTADDNDRTIWQVDFDGGKKKVLTYKANEWKDPAGSLLTMSNPNGTGRVARLTPDGDHAFLGGTRRFDDPDERAPVPFIKSLNLDSGETVVVFESERRWYETAQMLDREGRLLMVSRESASEPRDWYVRHGSDDVRLIDNKDYLPDITAAKVHRVQVTRPDGFKFWVTATLPQGVTDVEGRPAMFWFYPSETTDQAAYDRGQRNYNKNAFRRPSAGTVRLMLRKGYVVVQPDCPIVGDRERPNDQFLHQLRSNLSATIDTLEREDLIDRRLLALGGHSYGAFGTANAMIHTPFFKAGIAGAGNYNRSLTPFGFQREPRSIWQGREIYYEMSPIWHAENLTGAMLMYHGALDQNMGTFPIHSERMFAALEALGKPAALYMYPYEDHGQIAIETRLDMWARWMAWLDKYVRLPEDKEESDDDDSVMLAVSP